MPPSGRRFSTRGVQILPFRRRRPDHGPPLLLRPAVPDGPARLRRAAPAAIAAQHRDSRMPRTPEQTFQPLVDAELARPGITAGRMFGSPVLKVGGKVYAMLVKGAPRGEAPQGPVRVNNCAPLVACCPAWLTHSWKPSSRRGDAPVSTTTVWSSKEHHSCSIRSDRSRGHSAGFRVPPVQLLLEDLGVMTGEPRGELVLVFHLDQAHGVLLVDLGQGEGARGPAGIGGVDPIDERAVCTEGSGRSVEHDRRTGVILCTSTEPLVHAARAWYSWISPPRISRRVIVSGRAGPGPGIGRRPTSCGARRPSPRCGRCELWCAAYTRNTSTRCLR